MVNLASPQPVSDTLCPCPWHPPLDARQRPLGAPVRRSGVPCGVWGDPGYNDLIGHPLSRASYLSLLYHVPLVELAHSTGTDLKMWYIRGVERAGAPVSPESHCLFELR